jgi:hypothetical protein
LIKYAAAGDHRGVVGMKLQFRFIDTAQNIQLVSGKAGLQDIDVTVISKVTVAISSRSEYMH